MNAMQGRPKAEPGSVLRRMVEEMDEADRAPFVAWLEQISRQRGDLELLREVKAYRRFLDAGRPTPTRPPPAA